MWESIKAFGRKAVKYIDAIPMSTIIKVAIMAGVTIFTAVVLIRHLMKIYQESHVENSPRRSPVDEILGVNYVTDPEAFDELDPEAQRICRDLNKAAKKKGKKKVKTRKNARPKAHRPAKTVSLFDGPVLSAVDDEDFTEPVHYSAASEMMWAQERKPKKGAKAPKRNTRKAPIDRQHLQQLKAICDEWKASGRSAEEYRERIDAIARELGLRVDTLDQAVTESMRSEFGALF